MKHNTSNYIYVLILMISLCTLSGCSKKEQTAMETEIAPYNVEEIDVETLNEYRYATQDGDTVYIAQWAEEGNAIYSLPLDKDKLNEQHIEKIIDAPHLISFQAQNEKLYILYEGENGILTVDIHDKAGNLLKTVPSLWKTYTLEQCFAVDGEENFYIGDDSVIYVMTADGEELANLSLEGKFTGLTTLRDGRVAVVIFKENGTYLKIVNIEKKELDEDIEMNSSFGFCGGTFIELPGFDFGFSDRDGLYGYDINTKASTLLFQWSDIGINTDEIMNMIGFNNNSVLMETCSFEDIYNLSYSLYLMTPSSTEEEKIILKLSGINISETLTAKVNTFNKNHSEMQVQITNYEENDPSRSKFNAELYSNSPPDIIVVSGMPSNGIIKSGILEDLMQYIEKDPSIESSYFVEEILKAFMVNGELFFITPSFQIDTVLAEKSRLKYDGLWNLQAVKDSLDSTGLKEIVGNFSKEMLIAFFLKNEVEHLIDFSKENKVVDTFVLSEILEICNQYGYEEYRENSEETFLDKKSLLVQSYFFTVSDVQPYYKWLEGDIAFVGYPGSEGGNSFFYSSDVLGICSNSDYKEEAWEFIKYITLNEEIKLEYYEMPISQLKYKKMVEQPLSGSANFGGIEYERTPYSEEELNAFQEVMSTIKYNDGSDQELLFIIMEEAENYFNGKKGLESTVSIIENRIMLYVQEQK